METQTIVIILFALLVAVLILTCVCVDGAAKAANVRAIDRENVRAVASHHGCFPPDLFAPDFDGALVGYVYDRRAGIVRAVYSAELLEALGVLGEMEFRIIGWELTATSPIIMHTK